MRPYDADADAWDDTALVRAYDDAIARHGAPSNAPTARRRGSNEDERANDSRVSHTTLSKHDAVGRIAARLFRFRGCVCLVAFHF